MQSYSNNQCCLCKLYFDQTNFPRLMQSCDHSVCTNCLKNTFKNNHKFIICSFCNNQQPINQPDLQYFPKNITLIKHLKDSFSKKSINSQFNTPNKLSQNNHNFLSNTGLSSNKKNQLIVTQDFVPCDSSLISQKSSSSQQIQNRQICSTHNKQMQIICLTDFTKLCPLCAVFGTHKQHELKTIQQTSKILNETQKQFQQAKHKKKTLQTKIKNQQFKSQLIQKIALTKNNLVKQIKQKFNTLKQAIATAQKNANDDLNKRFKQVNDKINKMVKQQSEFQSFFTNWARTIQLQLAQTTRIGIKFQQKAQIYYNGPMKSMKEGYFYLKQIQSYTQQKKHKLQSIPSQVTIQLGQNLIKDIYNYLIVKFDDQITLPFNQNLLTSSRADTQHFSDSKNNYLQQNNLVPKNYALNTQPSSSKISSTNSIHSGQPPMSKKPIKVQFSSPQNFLNPNNRLQSAGSGIVSGLPPRKSPRQKSKSLPKQTTTSTNNLLKSRQSPAQKQVPTINQMNQMTHQRKKYLQSTSDGIVELFLSDDKLDTLDLCQFDMPDHEVIALLDYVNNKKKIKCLKLSQNKLTNEGFAQIIGYLKYVTNLNLSSNILTEDILNVLIKQRQKVPSLRILNLAHNKVNERKAKSYVDELKKQGIIVTLS